MDTVVANTLNLEVVEGWQQAGEVSEIRAVLGGARFKQLFKDRPNLDALPGRMSQLSEKQVLDLERMGVLRRKKKSDPPVLHVCKAFTVPKPSGKRRLIVDASGLGDQMVEPYYTELPSIDDVKRCVEKHAVVAQLDGKSYFYQFGASALQQYFAVRTCVGIFFLVVLAMGWTWSVYIAQTVAQTVMGRSARGFTNVTGLVYVDNFLLFGDSHAGVENAVSGLRHCAKECGLVFKGGDDSPCITADVLGMEVHMVDKTVRLCDAFRSKFGSFWEVYSMKPSVQSLRQTWKLFGGIFWAMRVLGIAR
ncbi:hypothetical protein DIPPA_18741 [Diplonema papillatum]|nr:hypothetical protein DIPPA_18741 [Diplonema papillatum]